MPRNKLEYRSTGKDTYERFCLKHPEIHISFKEYVKIIKTFNILFRDYILETGDKVKFPWGFGQFTIGKKKSKIYRDFNNPATGKPSINLPIDWKKTRTAGKYVYTTNSHTDGYRYKWLWFYREARFYQSTVWVFKPSRESSRKLAERLNKPNSPYAQIYKQWIYK